MTSHATMSRAVVNVLANWGAQVVSLSLAFFVTPFVVSTLGDSSYGIWMLVASIAGYLGLLDLGVRTAVTRYVARFAAAREDAAASSLLSSSVQIFGVMGVLATLASFGLALAAVPAFDIPEVDRGTARVVLVLVGVNVGVSLVTGAYGGIVAALQRLDLLNLTDVALGIVRTGLTVGALLAGQGLIAMAAIQLATSVGNGIWLIALSRRLYPALRLDLQTVNPENLRLIFAFSSLSFLIHVSGRLIYYTDALVIASFLPIGLLTFFSIASSLVMYARMLTSSVSFTTSPMASSFDGAGEHDRVAHLLLTSAKYSMMVLLPVAVTYLIRGRSFIALWMGPSYAGPSGQVLAVLALPLLFHAGAHGVGGIMMGVGKHKPMVPAMFVEAVANLALSIALLPTMGIVGVAWGTTIPSLVSSVFFWPWYARWALGIPVASYVKTIWIRPWLAAVPFALATYVVERWWPASTLPAFFTQVTGCVLLALAADWWGCVSRNERDTILAGVRRRFGRAVAPA